MSRIFRYATVGVASNLTGYLLFLLVTSVGIGPKIAMTVLYAAGAGIGFLGNRSWTFRHSGSMVYSGFRYAIAHLCGYLINLAILLIFVDRLGLAHQSVQGAAIFVVAGFLFVAFRHFVFPSDRGGAGEGG